MAFGDFRAERGLYEQAAHRLPLVERAVNSQSDPEYHFRLVGNAGGRFTRGLESLKLRADSSGEARDES